MSQASLSGHSSYGNRVVLVTGGAGSLGQALCEQLGHAGAIVVVTDINLDGAQRVAAAIEQAGGRGYPARLDVTVAGQVDQVIEAVAAHHGRLDYIFNNAAINQIGEVRDLEPFHWRQVLDLNLMGVLHCTLAAYRVMLRQGSGHIVNISSLAGLVGLPTSVPYTTAKHAVVGLSTTLRVEAAALGVRVSVACPGFLTTPLLETQRLGADPQKLAKRLAWLEQRRQSGRGLNAAGAARIILAEVAQNRGLIVFPLHARFIWLLQRLWPGLSVLLQRHIIEGYRRGMRQERVSP